MKKYKYRFTLLIGKTCGMWNPPVAEFERTVDGHNKVDALITIAGHYLPKVITKQPYLWMPFFISESE